MGRTRSSGSGDASEKPCFLLASIFFSAATVYFLIAGSLLVTINLIVYDFGGTFAPLNRLNAPMLIFCGVVLLAAAMASLVNCVTYATLLPVDAGKTWLGKQATREIGRMAAKTPKSSDEDAVEEGAGGVSEVLPSSEKPFRKERIFMRQTESITQVIPDPAVAWDGAGLYSLLQVMHVNQQGVLTFPPQRVLDDERMQS